MVKKTLLLFIVLLMITDISSAHDPKTNPELAELNDYMMAIQTLRHSDAGAESLFKNWQTLREESWEIREMTDDQGLNIDHPDVQKQVKLTTDLRTQLLENSRTYFSEKMDQFPSISIRFGDEISISGLKSEVDTPVGSREVVLVEFRTESPGHTHLKLESSESEEILFWSKEIMLTSDHPRYTFVYVAPMDEGTEVATITINQEDNFIGSFTVRGSGTLPATYDLYNHISAETQFDINHAEYSENEKTIDSENAIQFDIRDEESGDPLPVRVEVKDEEGNRYWTPLQGPSYAVDRESVGWQTPLWTFQNGPFFYINGRAKLGVEPEGKTARIYHGFEYEPVEVQVPEDGIVTESLKRWINMKNRGWYSGHTHIHTTDVGLPVQYSRFWPLVTQGEGLGVSAILTLQGERVDHAIYADEYPMGTLKSHSTSDHLITYGEEYRNNPYGHLALLGLDRLIFPIASGSIGEMGGPDYPPNEFILKDAVEQGGVTIGAHFGSYITEEEPIFATWPSTGFEMPVNAALGNMHLAEIYGNAGQLDVWYKLLNCGFNIFATSGPDWSMKDTPRAYVYLGEDTFNVDNWLDGLKHGRSFITKGPMLFFTVDGLKSGNQITYTDGSAEVHIEASALNPDGMQPVEIVVNGEVVANGNGINQTITLNDSAWIAARTEGAHSNPVFINFENRPRGYAEETTEFISVINRLEDWVQTKALFESNEQKEAVLDLLEEGRAVYESISHRAVEFGRTSPYQSD
ncbi:MAG: CehA/McbA family metallohydrolase [Balneolaceae bacterium]|nr:CehA/McbA family metallohydrolase [Balneolaceae bacterium]